MCRFFLIILCSLLTNNITLSQFQLEDAFPSLTFQRPVDLQHSGDGTNRIFVVEQEGLIRVFENSESTSSTKIFLNITDKVDDSGSEMGLLGLAFHPDFESNRYFYVNYTKGDPRQTIIARYQVTSNPDSGDKESELILLTVDQPFQNHNGGQTSFGPDGYLYLALGDGGSGGDPQNNAQTLSSLLGKILRIDVDTTFAGLNYGIPPDNPFLPNLSARPEIYAYGLRNPWRFSFDNIGKLWCGDVGQGDWEEIDTIQKGGNYGWRIMEGMHCYNASTCDTANLILPIHEYGHDSEGGFSITGGFVYEGDAVPEIKGRYIFADYVSRKVWSLGYYGINPELPIVELLLTAPAGVSSFGVDENNELYICAFDGKIYKFKTTITDVEDEGINLKEFELLNNYPNPFNPSTTIKYNLPERSKIKIEIIDLTGKTIANLIDGIKPSGLHQIEWNAKNFSSGIYYARMNAEGLTSSNKFQKVIKLVFMK